jgi:hypothetical protein
MPAAGREVVHRIVRLIGVYDADGTMRGEVSYWVGARLGRRHCSLCDITHGSIRRRPEWTACKEGLPVPFDTYHRNDQPDAVRAAAAGRTPVVVAETVGRPGVSGVAGHVVLLGPDELDACEASIDRLVEAIDAAVARLDLAWPAS